MKTEIKLRLIIMLVVTFGLKTFAQDSITIVKEIFIPKRTQIFSLSPISMCPFLVSSILVYIDKSLIGFTIGTTSLLIHGMVLGVVPIRSEDGTEFLLCSFPHTIMTSVVIDILKGYFS